ncbi:hypothetical protein P4O66_006254 [Electrophorus voltai]|uniref:Uncharacterized protein n=1 Tax=Electrophorus voltai TaxID=2609070 RepID=A0AAD8ZKG4_9TELE|nr:hypothetical protein P4O66_006254 [Electrophorus voltai]
MHSRSPTLSSFACQVSKSCGALRRGGISRKGRAKRKKESEEKEEEEEEEEERDRERIKILSTYDKPTWLRSVLPVPQSEEKESSASNPASVQGLSAVTVNGESLSGNDRPR